MGSKYLLDTNIVIYLLNGSLSENDSQHVKIAAQQSIRLSIISKLGLLGWKAPTHEEDLLFAEFVENSIIYDLDKEIIDKTIEIRRSKRIKLPDAIIAATAIVKNLILLTRNTSDFKGIPGLKFANPMVNK